MKILFPRRRPQNSYFLDHRREGNPELSGNGGESFNTNPEYSKTPPVDSTQTIVTVDTDTKIFGPVLGSSMDVIDISGEDSEVGW